jgi:hypothetical protein
MYLLHLIDVRNYLIGVTAISAATCLLVPGNPNWKGKYFTSGTYRQREMST